MKEKIKNLFNFVSLAWSRGAHGKFGVILTIFALVMFIRLFCGDVNFQKFAINMWHHNKEQKELNIQQKNLDTLNHHIELLQGYSADYVEELGLQYLNIGNPKVKQLKI